MSDVRCERDVSKAFKTCAYVRKLTCVRAREAVPYYGEPRFTKQELFKKKHPVLVPNLGLLMNRCRRRGELQKDNLWKKMMFFPVIST